MHRNFPIGLNSSTFPSKINNTNLRYKEIFRLDWMPPLPLQNKQQALTSCITIITSSKCTNMFLPWIIETGHQAGKHQISLAMGQMHFKRMTIITVLSFKRFGRKVPWKRMSYHLKLSSDLQTLVKIWANSSTSVFSTGYLRAISSQNSQLCFSWHTWCKGKAAAQLELPPPDVGLYNNQTSHEIT